MFTGLVQDVGTVRRAQRASDRVVFHIETTRIEAGSLELGESIAINGVCLTVTERQAASFEVLAGAETLARTTLGQIRASSRVNLERALRAGDRLGGHFVQGHVDGVGTIAARRDRGANLEIDIRAPAELARYCIEKGSIAIDGISLTLNRVVGTMLSVALIPHTVAETTLGESRPGDPVNLEVDMIAKYVEKLCPPRA